MLFYFYKPQAGTMPQVTVQCQVQLLELKFIRWREMCVKSNIYGNALGF